MQGMRGMQGTSIAFHEMKELAIGESNDVDLSSSMQSTELKSSAMSWTRRNSPHLQEQSENMSVSPERSDDTGDSLASLRTCLEANISHQNENGEHSWTNETGEKMTCVNSAPSQWRRSPSRPSCEMKLSFLEQNSTLYCDGQFSEKLSPLKCRDHACLGALSNGQESKAEDYDNLFLNRQQQERRRRTSPMSKIRNSAQQENEYYRLISFDHTLLPDQGIVLRTLLNAWLW